AVAGDGVVEIGTPYEISVTVEGLAEAEIAGWTVAWGDGAVDTNQGAPGPISHVYDVVGLTHDIAVSVTGMDGTTWTNADIVVPHYDMVDGVGRYSSFEGARIADLASSNDSLDSAFAAVIGPDGLVYVSGNSSNTIERYDPADNRHVDTFVQSGAGGLDGAEGLVFGPDGNLYVSSSRTGEVLRYDDATGAFVDSFVDKGTLNEPTALVFAPDGRLYVADRSDDDIERFDRATGAHLDTFTAFEPGARPSGLAWEPNGNLLVTLEGLGRIARVDSATGADLGGFDTAGLVAPAGLHIGPDGHLWVADYWTDQIVRFDRSTGSSVDPSIALTAPAGPRQFTFTPDHQVVVAGVTKSAPAATQAPAPLAAAGPAPSITFEPNDGQFDPIVDYFARGQGHSVFLADSTATILVDADDVNDAFAFRMGLVGGAATPAISPKDQQIGRVNYLIGSDPAKWQTDIATFGAIEFTDVYPGIDLRYYGNEQQIEYDFVVQPGADPSTIVLDYEGATSVSVDAGRNLAIGLDNGRTFTFSAPFTYQEIDGAQVPVTSGYALSGDTVRFKVDSYDTTLPLIIDPTLQYSTTVGGTQTDRALDIAVDSSGNAYFTGHTQVSSYPTTVGPQGPGGSFDIMVTKLSADGSSLVYSTLVGGSGVDGADAIAVDGSGNAYVAADSNSANFPLANAYDSSLNGAYDAVFFKLDPTGATLLYSTYWGGTGGFDQGKAIAIDASGDAVMAGIVDGGSMTTTAGVIDASFGGASEAFVVKFDPTQSGASSLLWATYLGGSDEDEAWGIDLDASDNVYVGGSTKSTNFPTSSAYQATNGGDNDAWVAKLNPTATTLMYSTYLGGDLADEVFGLDEDTGNIYATGYTNSTGTSFPTTSGAYQTVRSPSWDMVIAVVDPTQSGASSLLYSTLVGGDGLDRGNDIAVDSNGTPIVTGYTFSTDYPVTGDAYDSSLGSTWDAFITAIYPSGGGAADLAYSTYIGGSTGAGDDSGAGIALDASDDIYIGGDTGSTNFPTTTGPHGPGGNDDAFVMKFSAVAPSGLVVNSTGDASDAIAGDGVCDTGGTNSQGAAECTLRAAIEEANAAGNADDIVFAIPQTESGYSASPEAFTIQPGSGYDDIVNPVTIDGATQAEYTTDPVIQLDGSSAAGATAGLVLETDDSLINALIVHSFADEGLEVDASTGGGHNNTVSNNWVGLDAALAPQGNVDVGILLTVGAYGNLVDSNVVGDSGNSGIVLRNNGTDANIVSNNLVGVAPNGTTPMPNGLHGIELYDQVANNRIEDNVVANHPGDGISVNATSGTNNAFLRNSIHTNTGLGIDLSNDGVTANSNVDAWVNFPVITSATESAGTITVDFDIDLPAGDYRIEFFTNPTGADASGFGEGESYIDFYDVIAHPGGVASYSTTIAGFAGDVLTATSTEDLGAAYGSTSEFAANFTVIGNRIWVNSTGDATDTAPGDDICDTGATNSLGAPECTISAAIEEANASALVDSISFNMPTTEPGHSGGVWTISPATAITTIDSLIDLDATTQPGHVSVPIVALDGASAPASTDGLKIGSAGDGTTIHGFAIINFPDDGIEISSSADGVTLTENYVGVDATGTGPGGNGDDGVDANGGSLLVVSNNVVSDNAGSGIQLQGTAATIVGNMVGVGSDGSTPLGNGSDGISVGAGASSNEIGGTTGPEANIVANNGGGGISLVATAGTDNSVLGNSIWANTGLGIDLGDDGVTPNSNVDAWLNHPTATVAIESGGTVTVDFDLDVPAGDYRVEAFTNPSGADPTGNGEGESFEAATTITHTGSGSESFQIAYTGAVGDIIALTATEETAGPVYGSTSEFSTTIMAASPCVDTDTDGLCDLEEDANTDLDNNPATNPGPNTDGDANPNYLDPDDDGDGTPTASENADPNADGDPRDALDTDRDGQADYLDLPTTASDGTVDGEQKISDTTGGLAATLDDSDRFGRSVAPIGDLDGDGVVDLVVGAFLDDDGGFDRGAAHVLLMNANG
ncbi:MAG: SBBP repeat-containing protein, partial [Acidimicrobiales bacterium]